MPIFKKKAGGDLTGAPKRTSSTVSNQRAQQIKDRSQSGFKGETKNDHGLPLGGSMNIIQTPNANQPGAKFRKQKSLVKYADGTKKVRVDETDPNFIGPPREGVKQMRFGDRSTDTAIGATPRLTPTDSIPEERSAAQQADMAKVVAYQKKLVAAGAKIKVDGMWGKETEAASRQYHSKLTGSKSTSPKSKSVETVRGLQGGNIAASRTNTTSTATPTNKNPASVVKPSPTKAMNLSDVVRQQKSSQEVVTGLTGGNIGAAKESVVKPMKISSLIKEQEEMQKSNRKNGARRSGASLDSLFDKARTAIVPDTVETGFSTLEKMNGKEFYSKKDRRKTNPMKLGKDGKIYRGNI